MKSNPRPELDAAERLLNKKIGGALSVLYKRYVQEEDAGRLKHELMALMSNMLDQTMILFAQEMKKMTALAHDLANEMADIQAQTIPQLGPRPLFESVREGEYLSQARGISEEAEEALRGALDMTPQRDRRSSIRRTLDGVLESLAGLARRETYQTLRDTMSRILQRNPDIYRGWVWIAQLDEYTCGVCWALHGSEHRIDTEMISHFRCRCHQRPVQYGEPYGGGVESGPNLFDDLDTETQRKILGPGKLALYEAGDLPLRRLVGKRTHPEVGEYLYERPLKSLRRL